MKRKKLYTFLAALLFMSVAGVAQASRAFFLFFHFTIKEVFKIVLMQMMQGRCVSMKLIQVPNK
jgi:hypothetical protein